MEEVFKLCRNVFKYKPAINIEQFFAEGYAEHKSIMIWEIIDWIKRILKSKKSSKAKPAPVVDHGFSKWLEF